APGCGRLRSSCGRARPRSLDDADGPDADARRVALLRRGRMPHDVLPDGGGRERIDAFRRDRLPPHTARHHVRADLTDGEAVEEHLHVDLARDRLAVRGPRDLVPPRAMKDGMVTLRDDDDAPLRADGR